MALWRAAAPADEAAITSLYLNLVPALVQQVEPPPVRHSHDLVHCHQGELLGYLSFDSGPRGIWIQPYFHPGAEHPDRLLGALLSDLDDRRQRPLYVCVRSYQSWMTAPLHTLGFEALTDQAVMVKRLAVSIRQPQLAVLPALEASLPEADGSARAHRSRRTSTRRGPSMTIHQHITDNLDVLLSVLPPEIVQRLTEIDRFDELLEVILDIGRVPTARYVDSEPMLLEREVSRDDIEFVVARIGEFDADNRAGIERTLHRISAIRNRHGRIVGLTCRVGRAVYGTIDIIQDIITGGKSVLLLGRPGVGKTTMLREAARTLAESKRVVIVDTSNEIAGDGDVPHPAIGRARRMQVREPVLQHEVMIEAVENHNPEVIVIDEIGRELEAVAARTIAERGVQLIGTAHGNSLENLLLNPTLSDLVGGIESVTLSDEEARRRGTQKTVLERRAAPTFDVLVEIQDRWVLAVHHDVAMAVDAMLRGRPQPPEVRSLDDAGEVRVELPAPPPASASSRTGEAGYRRQAAMPSFTPAPEGELPFSPTPPHLPGTPLQPVRVYAYGVARNRLRQAARRLRVPATLVDQPSEADVIVTLRAYYRRHQKLIADAEARRVPVYVLRANTVGQMETFLTDLFNLEATPVQDPGLEGALQETQQAIRNVLNGARSTDLAPASAYIRRLQHQLARQANLVSHSYGKEPHRRVRIFRE